MSIYKNKNLLALKGKLFKFPTVLINYIADVFGYGWDRNRAIDSKGNHNNALMGGYLLAASNTVISIDEILTTDTIKALTKDGLVGSIAVNGTISFTTGNKYGAFEVYRGNLRIGRYCLTELQWLQIINQVTGGLSNGLLGGTTTTVWQRSNAFYSETNERGYSISGTGWVTSAGGELIAGTFIPADPANSTKCMAWVGGVQQDLHFVGKAQNSVSVVPYTANTNKDRYWIGGTYPTVTTLITTSECEIIVILYAPTGSEMHYLYTNLYLTANEIKYVVMGAVYKIYLSEISKFLEVPVKIKFTGANSIATFTIQKLTDGATYTKTHACNASQNRTPFVRCICAGNTIGEYKIKTSLASIKEFYNGVLIQHYVIDQHSTDMIELVFGGRYQISGISTSTLQNIDLVYNTFNQTGYEIWTNSTDYRIYPLSSTGTRIITPAGYEWQETVTAGNMPSVADSRMSTFKYALANSYAVRQSVPEAFDTADPCEPKLLTYPELSALSSNIKVTKTEVNGKITNLTIRQ